MLDAVGRCLALGQRGGSNGAGGAQGERGAGSCGLGARAGEGVLRSEGVKSHRKVHLAEQRLVSSRCFCLAAPAAGWIQLCNVPWPSSNQKLWLTNMQKRFHLFLVCAEPSRLCNCVSH